MSEVFLADEAGALSASVRSALEQAVRLVLEREVGAASARCEVGVTVVGPERIQTLNRAWRGEDKPTDVLSFPVDPPPSEPEGPEVALGDIVICPEAVEAEGEDARRGELVLLAVHGTLHLLGWDHDTKEAEAGMFALQDRYTAEVLER